VKQKRKHSGSKTEAFRKRNRKRAGSQCLGFLDENDDQLVKELPVRKKFASPRFRHGNLTET
jgi:hypothetical protein